MTVRSDAFFRCRGLRDFGSDFGGSLIIQTELSPSSRVSTSDPINEAFIICGLIRSFALVEVTIVPSGLGFALMPLLKRGRLGACDISSCKDGRPGEEELASNDSR